jgi:hypothetical protein
MGGPKICGKLKLKFSVKSEKVLHTDTEGAEGTKLPKLIDYSLL